MVFKNLSKDKSTYRCLRSYRGAAGDIILFCLAGTNDAHFSPSSAGSHVILTTTKTEYFITAQRLFLFLSVM